jgi:hypothetical protein
VLEEPAVVGAQITVGDPGDVNGLAGQQVIYQFICLIFA